MSTRKHRQFTAKQKSQYARLATESGKPISQIAEELDLTESALRKWIKQAQIDDEAAPEGTVGIILSQKASLVPSKQN